MFETVTMLTGLVVVRAVWVEQVKMIGLPNWFDEWGKAQNSSRWGWQISNSKTFTRSHLQLTRCTSMRKGEAEDCNAEAKAGTRHFS